jgi:hypothetical protein
MTVVKGGLLHAPRFCVFCRTCDTSKMYVCLDASNNWLPSICEDCIDSCTEALTAMRDRQRCSELAKKSAEDPTEPKPPAA